MAGRRRTPQSTGTAEGDYGLARHRVERARQAKSKTLSLRSLADLEELPPLDGLTHLRELDIRGTKVRDIANVVGAPNLLELCVAGPVEDLSPVAELKNLTRLFAWNVSSLAPLTNLSKLRALFAAGDFADISPIASCQRLRDVDLQSPNVRDLGPLSGLQGLQVLRLNEATNISDIGPLSELRRLAVLSLPKTNVRSVDQLAPLVSLTRLFLQDTPLEDASPLRPLNQMEFLNLGRTNISEISFVSDWRNLLGLDITGTNVSDVSPIAHVLSLMQQRSHGLYFANCPIVDSDLRRISTERDIPRATVKAINHVRGQLNLPSYVPDWFDITPESVDEPQVALDQRPAPYQFAWRQDLLVASATKGVPSSAPLVEQVLEELRRKCARALDSMDRNHADPPLRSSIEDFQKCIQASPSQVEIGRLIMRFRTLEAQIASLTNASSERARDLQAAMLDLVTSAEDLLALYPEIRELDAHRQALRFQSDEAKLESYRRNAASIIAAARASPIVDQTAVSALTAGDNELELLTAYISTPTDEETRATIIAQRAQVAGFQALDVRNFVLAPLKRVADEFGPIGGAAWKEVKQAIPRGVGQGVEGAVSGSVKAAAALLVASIAGPIAGIGVIIASFAPLAKRAEGIARELGQGADAEDPQTKT